MIKATDPIVEQDPLRELLEDFKVLEAEQVGTHD